MSSICLNVFINGVSNVEVPSPTVPNTARIASSPTVQLMIIPTFAVIRLFRARQGRWRHEKSESM